MVTFTLQKAGYEVLEASDGNEALTVAARSAVALVLTDQNMPGMNGLTLVRNLRASPRYAKVPILMLTTEAGEEIKSQGRAAGATGWIVKPFNPDTLLQIVRKVIG